MTFSRFGFALSFGLLSCIVTPVFGASAAPILSARPDPDLVAALNQPKAKPTRKPVVRKVASVDESNFEEFLPPPQSKAVDETNASIRTTYAPPREKRVSLIIPSVVVHGFAIDKEVADQMPRKLDNGQTVVTPGVGLEYVSHGGFLVIGGMLKDCYDNLAGMLQVGQQFHLASHTTIGYSLGIYARETPIACQTTVTRTGRKITTCDEFDNYQLKWMTQVNGEDVDIIPMPFIHFTTALYRDSNFEIDFKVTTNFALNEFGFSIPF